MADTDPNIDVALEYYRALRTEVIERIKARDTIMLGYLAAVAVLLGVPSQSGINRGYLPFVIPLLGFAAAASIAQHQELVTTLSVYLAGQWRTSLTSAGAALPADLSAVMKETRRRSFNFTLATQLGVMVAPSVFIICTASWRVNPGAAHWWERANWPAILGTVLTFFTGLSLYNSRRWRERLVQNHLPTPTAQRSRTGNRH